MFKILFVIKPSLFLEPFSGFLLSFSSIHLVNSVLQVIFLDSPSKSKLEGSTWVPQSTLDFSYNVYVRLSLLVCHCTPQIHELHKSWDCTVYILSKSRCLILECRKCKRCAFDPRSVRKNPWKSKWQCTPVFLPGKSYGQRSLVGYSPWGCKRVRHDWVHTILE